MISLETYKLIPLSIGYLLVFLSSFLIKANIDTLWSKIKRQKNRKKLPAREPWHPHFLGLMNMFMYLTSFIYGKPEFIIGWLAIGTVQQISYWRNDNKTLLNIFLIGNAMNIIFSFVSFMIILLLTNSKILEASIIGITCTTFFVLTWLYSRGLEKFKM